MASSTTPSPEHRRMTTATTYPIEERGDGLYVELPTYEYAPTLMDQMVDVMTGWGVDTVFGMVGHSNLGLADALRRAEEDGRLRYYGIRHEGAGAFAASAYGKLTGRPAACFSIAGPGATTLLTGLWMRRSTVSQSLRSRARFSPRYWAREPSRRSRPPKRSLQSPSGARRSCPQRTRLN